jgi:ACT domain-containing protein
VEQQHQKDLSLRRSDSTAHCVRMDTVNKETMKQYFALLKDVLDEHDLLSNPAQI